MAAHSSAGIPCGRRIPPSGGWRTWTYPPWRTDLLTLPPLTWRDGSRLDVECICACICACDMPSACIPHLKCQLQEKSSLRSEASALLHDHYSGSWHWGIVPETEPCAPWVGMQIGAATLEKGMRSLRKLKTELPCDLQSASGWVLIRKNWNRDLKETVALPQHYS